MISITDTVSAEDLVDHPELLAAIVKAIGPVETGFEMDAEGKLIEDADGDLIETDKEPDELEIEISADALPYVPARWGYYGGQPEEGGHTENMVATIGGVDVTDIFESRHSDWDEKIMAAANDDSARYDY